MGEEGGKGQDNAVKHVVSFSGGKDSTAMLLMMLEKKMQVDEIVFCDTGKEFPGMYDHIKQVEEYIGRKVTVLRAEKTFDYLLGEHMRGRGNYTDVVGMGWPDMNFRWCTGELKRKIFARYFCGKEVIQYHGIAHDEPKRIRKFAINIKYPLYDWGITEKQALEYCNSLGFTWGGCTKYLVECLAGAARCNH